MGVQACVSKSEGRRLATSRCATLSTASDPQAMHRPWVSNAVCSRQLAHHHCLIMVPPLPTAVGMAEHVFEREQWADQERKESSFFRRFVFCPSQAVQRETLDLISDSILS
jgi:hypothetical protein